MSKQPALARLRLWLDDYVSHWALLLWSLGASSAGLVIGMLIGGGGNADWVEASGTWASVAVTLAAVIVAFRAFTTETRDRLIDRSSEMQQLETAQAQQRSAEAANAAKIDAWGSHMGGYHADGRDGVTWLMSEGVRVTVENLSADLVTNIEVEVRLADLPPIKSRLLRLEAGTTGPLELTLPDRGVVSIPREEAEARPYLSRTIHVSFDMSGSRWVRSPDGPVTRLSG